MPRLDPAFRTSINGYLRKHYPDLCRHWFDDIEPLDMQAGVLRLVVREPVQLRYLQRCCTSQFSEAAQSVTGRLLVVRFIAPEEAANPTPTTNSSSVPPSDHGNGQSAHPHGSNGTTQDHLRTERSPDSSGPGVDPGHPNGVGHDPQGRHTPLSTPSVFTEVKPGERFASQTEHASFHAPHSGTHGNGFGSGTANWTTGGTSGGTSSGGAAGGRHEPEVFAALDDQTLLSPDYSFENFVVGPNNRLAHAAAIAVGEKPGRAYNPYFVHGGVGLGKTHLLQAICQTILRKNPRARICYISCNTFMDLFHDAVKAGRMSDFRSRFRTVDVLVIDDIHFLSKREQTQEEFFHTFNTLYQGGKQIVLSSDAAPSEIPDLEERLTSRFSCGLVARIDRPDYETRVSIVKTKAALHDLTLPDDVPAYIAAKIDSNIRELEGALTKLRGLAAATGQPMNLELAKQALSDLNPSTGASQPTIQMIIEEVSRFFDVKLTDLLSKRRHKSIALPRQVCMWLARKHTRYSLEEIGGYFGGRDHTTVMHAIKTINEKRGADGKLLADVSRLEEQLLQRVR